MSDEAKGAETKGPSSGGGGRLLANRERILSLWEERLRQEVPAATQESHPILIDTLPVLLRQLAEALSAQHPRRTATEGSNVAEEHGSERVRVTRFRLGDVLTEYRLLREVLFTVLEEHEPLSASERNTLNASLDQAVSKACTGFVLVQEGLRERLYATLAHDLRGPLSAAKINAGLILRQPSGELVPRWAAR
ncbi:hypothetical protein ACN47A_17980, partial [Myxococcus fulvus]